MNYYHRIVKTTELERGAIKVFLDNGAVVNIWKGDYYQTIDGTKWRNYIDGFRYSVVFKDALCEFEEEKYLPHDQILNMLERVSRNIYD